MHVPDFASLLYNASLDILIYFVFLFFVALGFCFVSCVSFCLCRLFCALVIASPHLSSLVLRLGLARAWEAFWAMGGGVGGGRLNARTALCVSPPLAGWGARMLWLEKEKDLQRSRGRQSTDDGASWLKKEKDLQVFLAGSRDLVAGTARRIAQVGSS